MLPDTREDPMDCQVEMVTSASIMPRPPRLNSTVLTTSVELLKGDDGKPLSREALLQRAFGNRYTVQEIDVTAELMTHLDTADWRLRKGGIDLAFVPSSGQLVAHRGSSLVAQPVGSIGWPALISNIPDGPVRDLIQDVVWVRALLPFATSQDHCNSFAVLNTDAKTVARVRWREGSVQAPQERRLPVRVQVDPLRGYAADAAKVERRLTLGTPLSATRETWFEALWAMPGLGPAATERFGMQRSQAADLAVADALLGYLAEIEANVAGIVSDIDTEYLHEFRVAVRRTRSVLKLLGDVLPDGLADRVGAEFRWLGDVTSPTRDLDVYLLGIDDMAKLVARPGGLDAFGVHVRKRRAVEHRALVRALRSARFVDLCATWRVRVGRRHVSTLAAPGDCRSAGAGAPASDLPQGDQASEGHHPRLAVRAGARVAQDVQGDAVSARGLQTPLQSQGLQGRDQRLQGVAGRARRLPGRRGPGRRPARVRAGDDV